MYWGLEKGFKNQSHFQSFKFKSYFSPSSLFTLTSTFDSEMEKVDTLRRHVGAIFPLVILWLYTGNIGKTPLLAMCLNHRAEIIVLLSLSYRPCDISTMLKELS